MLEKVYFGHQEIPLSIYTPEKRKKTYDYKARLVPSLGENHERGLSVEAK